MMRILTQIIILLIVSVPLSVLNAQTPKTDSLKTLLKKQTENDTSTVILLNKLAETYKDTKESELALEYTEKAIKLADILNFKKGKGQSFKIIGNYYYYNKSNIAQALVYYNKSLKIKKELNDKQGEAILCYNIALVYLYEANYPKAIEYIQQSLKISEAIDDQIGLADGLIISGIIQERQSNYPEAFKYYQEALKIYEKISNKDGVSRCLRNIGNIYREWDNYAKALEYFQKSLKIDKELGAERRIADCLNDIGGIYLHQGNYPKTLEYYQKSLAIDKKNYDKQGMALRLNNISLIYRLQGNYSKAFEYSKESLKIREGIGDKPGIAACLNTLGRIYCDNGDYIKALEYYNKSLAIFRELGNDTRIAICLNNIGNTYKIQGGYTKAFEYYQKSLKIAENIDSKYGVSTSLNNIGSMYYAQGNYPKALSYYQQSLKIREETGNKLGVSTCLSNIGSIQSEQGNYNRALAYYQKSLKLRTALGYKQGISSCLSSIGNIKKYQGEYSTALAHYQKSLKIDRELGYKHGISIRLNNIGQLFLIQDKNIKAFGYFQEALGISEKISDKRSICISCFNIGEFYLKTGKYKHALDYTNKSFKIAKELELLGVQKDLHKQFSEIYAATKNYRKAYENHLLYKGLNDSVFNKENIKTITGLELQYKYEKEKQAEKLIQQKKDEVTAKEIEYQKKINKLFIAGLLVALLIIFLFYRIVRIKKKANNILRIKNERITQQKDLISEQKSEIQAQADELQEHKTNLEAIVEQRTAAFFKAKEQAEESDRLKTAFLNNISHEFRTPMNGILGFSALLIQSENSESKQKYANVVDRSCKQLLNIVNDTVEISKIHSRQSKLNKSTVNIANIIHEIINEFKDSALKKGLDINLELKIAEENSLVFLDKNKFERVFWHLIDNAIKFSYDGQIKVIAYELDKGNIQFQIDDNGIGIPVELQKKIFDPFRQVETGTERKFGGNGIGLSIAKAYIEMLGGNIWLKSQMDKGTSIFFTLPIHSSIDSEPSKPINPLGKIEGKTILLAEDDDINFALIREMLSEYNINLLHAWNGREGVEIFKQKNQIDIVLMDLKMPVMDGYEALKIIRGLNPNVPVFAQTAYASANDREEIIQVGFNDYITKPIHKDKLVQMLRQKV